MLSLERARLRRGLTQQALADLAGLDQDTIWRIETGRTRPRPSTRLAIATALRMEISEIRELADGDDDQDGGADAPPAD